MCLGHRAFGASGSVYIDCLRGPKPGSRKCVRCSVVDAAFASNVHHAHRQDRRNLDPLFAQHLAQPNILYLAAFPDGSIKVGTAVEHRLEQRLREQGAFLGRLIARATDGYVVREAEDLIAEFVGISQSVGIGRKLSGLLHPLPEHTIQAELDWVATKAVGLLTALKDPRLSLIDEPWINPRSGATAWDCPLLYPLELGRGSHDLEVLDAMGRIVALGRQGRTGRREPEILLADIGQLFGYVLDVGDYRSDEIAVQPALF